MVRRPSLTTSFVSKQEPKAASPRHGFHLACRWRLLNRDANGAGPGGVPSDQDAERLVEGRAAARDRELDVPCYDHDTGLSTYADERGREEKRVILDEGGRLADGWEVWDREQRVSPSRLGEDI